MKYSEEERLFFKGMYGTMSNKELSALWEHKFGIKRSAASLALYNKQNNLGLSGYKYKSPVLKYTCEKCGSVFEAAKISMQDVRRYVCDSCKAKQKSEQELVLNYIKDNQDKPIAELKTYFKTQNINLTPSVFNRYLDLAQYPRKRFLSKEVKEVLFKYVSIQHRKSCSWIREHIKKKYDVDVSEGTIRTWKSKIGRRTNLNSCRRDWLNFIRKNYKRYTDKELAKLLKDKFQRDISWMHVKKLRIKYHLLKPRTKGKYTVKEIRKCLYCGKDIKITCRNPNQKYCSTDCVHKAQRQDKRNLSVCSKDMINSFIKKYHNFAKAVIYQNRETLSNMDCEDLYSDYLCIVPSLVYGVRKYAEEKYIRGYIAKAIKNLILKKHNERNDWHAHNVELESLFFKFL